jgi:quinol---cytochrome c reductase iron-sulfur subunit, bacillus type
MGPTSHRPAGDGPAFDPRTTPVRRRTVLVLLGAGAVAATGGLSVVLQGCAGPPVTVTLDVDPAMLAPGSPTELTFPLTIDGWTVEASVWLVRQADGGLVAFDPRCTHASCAYDWSADRASFQCRCHDGQFGLDGTVLSGPPPRPLDRFPVRQTAAGIELVVPDTFVRPKESLG